MTRNEFLRLDLIATANKQNAAYPQYTGHFDRYVLVRIKRKVTTKMGLAFGFGELAIAKPEGDIVESGRFAGRKTMTVYSVSNQCDTSVFATDVELI